MNNAKKDRVPNQSASPVTNGNFGKDFAEYFHVPEEISTIIVSKNLKSKQIDAKLGHNACKKKINVP